MHCLLRHLTYNRRRQERDRSRRCGSDFVVLIQRRGATETRVNLIVFISLQQFRFSFAWHVCEGSSTASRAEVCQLARLFLCPLLNDVSFAMSSIAVSKRLLHNTPRLTVRFGWFCVGVFISTKIRVVPCCKDQTKNRLSSADRACSRWVTWRRGHKRKLHQQRDISVFLHKRENSVCKSVCRKEEGKR